MPYIEQSEKTLFRSALEIERRWGGGDMVAFIISFYYHHCNMITVITSACLVSFLSNDFSPYSNTPVIITIVINLFLLMDNLLQVKSPPRDPLSNPFPRYSSHSSWSSGGLVLPALGPPTVPAAGSAPPAWRRPGSGSRRRAAPARWAALMWS